MQHNWVTGSNDCVIFTGGWDTNFEKYTRHSLGCQEVYSLLELHNAQSSLPAEG